MSRFAIGVDLGGTNLRVAAIDEAGQVLGRVAIAVRSLAGRDAVIEELCRAVEALALAQQDAGSFAGVGVGVPGILYVATGLLRASPNLPGWENFAVREALQQRLGVSVIVDNDANAAAIGEKWLGAGRTVSSLCLLTLGTGLGGGLVCEGRVWRGFLGMAGEIGHINVKEDGAPCGCGSNGCLETEVSATAVIRKAQELIAGGKSPALARAVESGSLLTSKLIYDIAQAGDPAAREIFQSFGRYLGLGLAALVNILNLPLYVIGGGAADAWPLFSPATFAELNRRSYVFAEKSTRVERAQLGNDAGLYGAAYLVFQADALGATGSSGVQAE